MNAINKIPGRMKPEEWDKFIRTKLTSIEIIDTPTEAKFAARVIETLRVFFEMCPQGRTMDELSIGRWYMTDTQFRFRGQDFCNFIDRQGFKWDYRKVWNTLRLQGVVFQEIKIRSINTQVWCAPADMYTIHRDPLPKQEMPIEDF
jgi:hypothetical protein